MYHCCSKKTNRSTVADAISHHFKHELIECFCMTYKLACSSAVDVVGRMAGYWNYPILTPVGTDDELGNKNDFRTLTRLAFNYEHLGRFYRSVFREFNWTDITVMYDVLGKRQLPARNFNRLIGENLHNDFVKAGLTCTLLKFVSDSRRDYVDVLTAANRTSRGRCGVIKN